MKQVYWMATLDGVDPADLVTGMNQKQLRQWKRKHPGHRTFTVLRHPVARAHSVFCERILSTGPGSYLQIRETLRKRFKVPILGRESQKAISKEDQRTAFFAYLEFVRMNLSGQTAIRVDSAWATQAQSLSGFGEFVLPDYVLREDEMAGMLPKIASQVGHLAPEVPKQAGSDSPYALADIYDDQLESLVANVYQRDYLLFGFGPWA